MALDFPDSPVDGQIFAGYTYNSAVGTWRAPSRETLSGLSDVSNIIRRGGSSLQYYSSGWQGGFDYKIIDVIRVFGTTSADVTQNFSIGDYPGATALHIQAQGGGGGGGGAAATSASNAVGGGGGGGEYSELFIDLTNPNWVYDVSIAAGTNYSTQDRIPSSVLMTAGRGGAGGAAGAAGVDGNDSYFWFDDRTTDEAHWCGAEGGTNGTAGTSLATNRYASGGLGGNNPAAGGGNFNITDVAVAGESGETVLVLGATTVNVAASGRGGMSKNSGGGAPVVINAAGGANGNAASGYGGGGSGGVNTGTQATARTGGAGSPGFVFVTVLG